MRRPSRFMDALHEFESELENLLEQESDITVLDSQLWKGTRWKTNWYATMLAVSAYSAWERLAAKLVIALFTHEPGRFASEKQLLFPKRILPDVAEAILASSSGYIDFRGLDELVNRTTKWFVNNPFDNLTADQRNALEDLRVIRNAVVHGSRMSRIQMEKRLGKGVTAASILMQPLPTGVKLREYLNTLKSITKVLR